MSLIDSHTHLYFTEQFPNPSEAVRRSIDAGVEHMVLPGVNASTITPVRRLHEQFPENTSMGAGLHPSDVEPGTWLKELEIIEKELREHRDEYVTIGETGIDLHWDKTYLDLQQQSFERQLRLAVDLDFPVIIHSRDAFDATYEVLDGVANLPPIVFHSYSGDVKETEKILGKYNSAYFGINGIVTFKNAKIKEVLPVIPDSKLMIETDAPYLAPVPKRGSINESAFLVHTTAFVANEKNMTFDELAALTTANARLFFHLKV